MYGKLIQSCTNTWKDIASLKMLKMEMNEYDYWIYFDIEELPDSSVLIAYEIRNNLLRYGDILPKVVGHTLVQL